METLEKTKCKDSEIPRLLEVIIKLSKNGKGFRGFVNEPENKHHRQLVLFPEDGREMDLALFKVAFIVEHEASQIPIQPRGFALLATPVGKKSFFVSNTGRVLAENIIRERMGLPLKGLPSTEPTRLELPKQAKGRPITQPRRLSTKEMVIVTLLMIVTTVSLVADVIVGGRHFNPSDLAVVSLLAVIVILIRGQKFPSPSESWK